MRQIEAVGPRILKLIPQSAGGRQNPEVDKVLKLENPEVDKILKYNVDKIFKMVSQGAGGSIPQDANSLATRVRQSKVVDWRYPECDFARIGRPRLDRGVA